MRVVIERVVVDVVGLGIYARPRFGIACGQHGKILRQLGHAVVPLWPGAVRVLGFEQFAQAHIARSADGLFARRVARGYLAECQQKTQAALRGVVVEGRNVSAQGPLRLAEVMSVIPAATGQLRLGKRGTGGQRVVQQRGFARALVGFQKSHTHRRCARRLQPHHRSGRAVFARDQL